MPEIETGRFTVAVFQDVDWARRGLEALKRHEFPIESLSVLGRDEAAIGSLIEEALGAPPEKMTLRGLGAVLARGPLLDALDGAERDLAKVGMAVNLRKVGFQAHDGFIFETLAGRGGVLVAIRSEPRAADALAVLHAYGGGNAAIGAWTGRL